MTSVRFALCVLVLAAAGRAQQTPPGETIGRLSQSAEQRLAASNDELNRLRDQVAAEKLLVYGLGRGAEYQDMPLVRSLARDAQGSGNRFSALVLGVVKSRPFQMNTKTGPAPAAQTASIPTTQGKGAN